MAKLIIKDANIVADNTILADYSILCDGGKIIEIAPTAQLDESGAEEIIQAQGRYLVPGFIDLHFHGLLDFLIDNGIDDLSQITKHLPRYGVTSFLPTICPLPKGDDAKFLASLSHIKSEGTNILGFHLEGPFLTMTGALPPEAIGEADTDRVTALIEAAKPYKTIFSISPDFDKIEELIPIMAQNNTPVFMTHTAANVEQTIRAIAAGASHATHFYDVFPCPQETDPGVRPCGAVEAILADKDVSVDFILDGEHVDPVAIKMALQCKGSEKVCLITDANIGSGGEIGVYKFGNEEVEFKYPGGPARLTETSAHPGGLAGSGLTMDQAFRNASKLLNIDLPLISKLISTNPARVLGIEDQKGKIAIGYDADFVLLDKELQIEQTFIAGKSCYIK